MHIFRLPNILQGWETALLLKVPNLTCNIDLECINKYERISLIKSLIYRSAEETSFCAFTPAPGRGLMKCSYRLRLSTNLKGMAASQLTLPMRVLCLLLHAARVIKRTAWQNQPLYPLLTRSVTVKHSDWMYCQLPGAKTHNQDSHRAEKSLICRSLLVTCGFCLGCGWRLNIWRSPTYVPDADRFKRFRLFLLNWPLQYR